MKTRNIYFITTLLLCSLYSNCFSQELTKRIKICKIWVSGKVDMNGIFYEATDSSIIILANNKNWKEIDKESLIEVNVKDIRKVSLRGINNVRNGAIIGFIPMAVAGGVFAFIVADVGDDDVNPANVIVFGLVAGAGGASIGAVIGSIKKNYRIDYRKDLYLIKKAKFEHKSIKAQMH